jgi:DNA-binding response OmpR family regulator
MLKVLIAEDELLIADLLEETLISSGYEVCGIARSVDEAVALGERHRPDLAILDVRLARGSHGPDIVRRLNNRREMGVLYATGGDFRTSTLTLADGDAMIAKPYRPVDAVRALAIVRELVSEGSATPPFPLGFRLLSEVIVPLARASSS